MTKKQKRLAMIKAVAIIKAARAKRNTPRTLSTAYGSEMNAPQYHDSRTGCNLQWGGGYYAAMPA